MKRSDGAKAWSTVLSELARVKVSVEWERPTWRVVWQDGPTREALMGRAAALGRYRVGAPLPFEDLRFARSNSAVAIALGWLARGSPESPAQARAAIAEVEAFCADTGYPQTRFDAGVLAAAELLRRVSHGDIAEMGVLLAQAVPPVPPSDTLAAGADLAGRVVSYRWPASDLPEELLGPSGQGPEPGADTARARTCQRCGKPLTTDGSRGGRSAGQVLRRVSAGQRRTADGTAQRRRPRLGAPVVPCQEVGTARRPEDVGTGAR